MKSVSCRLIFSLILLLVFRCSSYVYELTLVLFSLLNVKHVPLITIIVSSASCMDNPDSEMVFYLMLRAVDRFYQQHSRYPGTSRILQIFFFKDFTNSVYFVWQLIDFSSRRELFDYCQTILTFAICQEGQLHYSITAAVFCGSFTLRV